MSFASIVRRTAIVFLLTHGASRDVGAQTERDSVLATVQKVFDAMRTRDTSLLKAAFDASARLVGLSRRGSPAVTLMTPSRFGAAIIGANPARCGTRR